MVREELIAAIEQAAKRHGYAYYTGMEYRIGVELEQLPALWTVTPRMTKKEGHERGIVEYEVVIHLIELPKEQSTEYKESLWGDMERVAMEIVKELERDRAVKAVTNQSYKPKEGSLTNCGEVSIEARFRVEMPFHNNAKKKIDYEDN